MCVPSVELNSKGLQQIENGRTLKWQNGLSNPITPPNHPTLVSNPIVPPTTTVVDLKPNSNLNRFRHHHGEKNPKPQQPKLKQTAGTKAQQPPKLKANARTKPSNH